MPRRPRETDALVRLLRGYGRLYDDPPEQQGTTVAETRLRVGKLMADAFRELDGLLQAGESMPEAWKASWFYEQPIEGQETGPEATTPDGPSRGKEPQ